MKLTRQEEAYFNEVLKDLLKDEYVLQMKNYIQHGNVTTYEHCLAVARKSYALSLKLQKKLHIEINLQALIIGAFLHDFYLYDWHEKKLAHKIHGFTHPKKAMKNAEKYYNISALEKQIIQTHMWPLTITSMPVRREAWIVCVADKYVSTKETLCHRK